MERDVCPRCDRHSTFKVVGKDGFKEAFNRLMVCESCGAAFPYCEIRVYTDAEREQVRQRKLARKRELSRLRRKANPDIDRDYYARNRELICARKRARYRCDPETRDSICAKYRAYRAANLERCRERERRYYREHAEERRMYQKRHRLEMYRKELKHGQG